MALNEKLYTVEEFWEFCQRPENENLHVELIGGIIVEMPPSSQNNTVIAMRIGRLLGNFVDEQGLGYVTGADGGFRLGENEVRIPDTAFIAKDRVSELSGTIFPVAPDIAVEVISPSVSPRMVLDKVRAYLSAGTQIVWTVYPDDEVIDVCHLDHEQNLVIQTIGQDGELHSGDVLPSFTLSLRQIFHAP
jgi:Uma2 family endonuclease